jgi:hypothetical protein
MLWLAIVIYSAGLGLILYTRPSLMFMESGAWKEFGYQRGPRYTVFPFWLFAIVWAIVSYSLSAAITVGFGTYSYASGISTMTAASAASRVGTGWGDSWASADEVEAEEAEEEAEEEEAAAEAEEEAEAMMPPKRRRGRPRKLNMFPVSEESNMRTATATGPGATGKPRSGYYVLEEPASNTGGLRRYVYYGDNPPSVSTQ